MSDQKQPIGDASIRDLVIEMRTDLRNVLSRLDSLAATTAEASKDHESRLRELERGFWKTSGAAAAISAAVAFAAKHSPF